MIDDSRFCNDWLDRNCLTMSEAGLIVYQHPCYVLCKDDRICHEWDTTSKGRWPIYTKVLHILTQQLRVPVDYGVEIACFYDKCKNKKFLIMICIMLVFMTISEILKKQTSRSSEALLKNWVTFTRRKLSDYRHDIVTWLNKQSNRLSPFAQHQQRYLR